MALDSGHALALAEIFWPTFVREGEATFVRSLRADARQALDSFESALDAEAFVNHLHVLDLLRHSASLPDEPWWDSEHADFVNACRLGVLLCEAWTAKLRADFPEEDFAVFYTQQDNPVVRFHRIRADGQLWLDPGNSRPMFDSGAALLLTSLSGRRFGAV